MTDAMQREFPRLAARLHGASRSFLVRVDLLARTGKAIDVKTDPAALELVAASDALEAFYRRAMKAMAAEPRPVWSAAGAPDPNGGWAHAQ